MAGQIMITITIPHSDPEYDRNHGVACWVEDLTFAHYVWERAGTDLRDFQGRRSIDCADEVRQLLVRILEDPDQLIGTASYPDIRATVADLTGLFFTLRQRPDGIVQVR